MANKFLGLDSVNVLKDYIDKQIRTNNENTKIITIYAYKYVEDGVIPDTPASGSFDPEGANIAYPEGWTSLKVLLNNIGDNEAIEEALSKGSIWLSVGIAEGNIHITDNWSTPIKISGQNGVSVRFAYSYNPKAEEKDRTKYPSGVNSEHRIEYVWTKYGDDEWQGPTIWSMYSVDATNVVWRYCLSSGIENGQPINPTTWSLDLPLLAIDEEFPYMWMSYKIIPARPIDEIEDEPNSTTTGWTSPVLFGHYGKNGKDGKDGNVPDYILTLYKLGEGFTMPDKPESSETNNTVEEFKKANESWLDLPIKPESEEELPEFDITEDDPDIWWQCSVKVHYNEEKDVEEIIGIGDVHRYNAVDGNAKPGQFTKYLFYWSETQDIPNDLNDSDWEDTPSYDASNQEGSLWMKVTDVKIGATGQLEPLKPWSDPIKLTGPRGPIAYDYRMEIRYNIGTATSPTALPTDEVWEKDAPPIEPKYPYVWAANYLMYYTMGYDENGKIVTLDEGTVIKSYSPYRLSGIDGEDGNRKNSLVYTNASDTTNTIEVTSFSENNLYISNSNADVKYNINLDTLSFITGYTGKFANIGTGIVTITIDDDKINNFKFIGSCTNSTTITLNPQEYIELVCYNNGDNKELLVIGKSL